MRMGRIFCPTHYYEWRTIFVFCVLRSNVFDCIYKWFEFEFEFKFDRLLTPLFVLQVDPGLVAQQLQVVQMVKQVARFVCLYMYYQEMRIFQLNAYDEGMLNGEYVFFGNEMTPGKVCQMLSWRKKNRPYFINI